MKSFAAACLICLAAPAAALAAPGGPTVDHAWARPTMGAMGMSAVYLDIHGGAAADRLISASTRAAHGLELHQTTTSGGMSGMQAVPSLAVPAHGEVKLAPGGYHLMLMGAAHPLKVGERVTVTLRFAKAGAVTVDAPVRATAPQ